MKMPPAQKTRSVKVSPPGRKSQELLARMKKVIGRSNYFGLYGVTLVGGESDEEAELITNTIYEVAEEMSTNQIPKTTIDKVHKYAIGL